MLPEEAIKELKILYAKNFGVELSDEEATRRANNLVGLYKAVYGDTPSFRQKDKNIGDKITDSKK